MSINDTSRVIRMMIKDEAIARSIILTTLESLFMIITCLKEGGSVSAFSGDGRMAFIKLENVS
jgi:hypothetical protein